MISLPQLIKSAVAKGPEWSTLPCYYF